MVEEVIQGLLENTSSNALNQLEVLFLSHQQGNYVGETTMPLPLPGSGALGTAMRLKHGNNATSASEGTPCYTYLLGQLSEWMS